MPDPMNRRKWTTYCYKHQSLERVDDVTEVRPFPVQAILVPGLKPERTGQTGTEVRAITNAGCKAHFIGGIQWNQ